MSAKASDFARVQEMYDIIKLTQRQIAGLGITETRFKEPANDADELIAEGIMNRVFRLTEEAGALSDEALARYDFDRRSIKGVRNRLAHAYGSVDRDVLWRVVTEDFDKLLEGCHQYCDDRGLELEESRTAEREDW